MTRWINGNWAWGALSWNADRASSQPLIVLNVIFHVIGLGFINTKAVQVLAAAKDNRYFLSVSRWRWDHHPSGDLVFCPDYHGRGPDNSASVYAK
jgi:hypothetical protein